MYYPFKYIHTRTHLTQLNVNTKRNTLEPYVLELVHDSPIYVVLNSCTYLTRYQGEQSEPVVAEIGRHKHPVLKLVQYKIINRSAFLGDMFVYKFHCICRLTILLVLSR